MVSSLAKSAALASLFVAPSSLAFSYFPVPDHLHFIESVAFASLFVAPSSRAFTSLPPSGTRHAGRPSRLHNDVAASAQQEQEGPQEREQTPRVALPAAPPPPPAGASSPPSANRAAEFHGLEARPTTAARRARLDAEARARLTFEPAGSEAYWELRDEIDRLEEELDTQLGAPGADDADVEGLRRRLLEARVRDPEYAYRRARDASTSDFWASSVEQRVKYEEERRTARSMLPQFNLEGLWVGKYGSHGFEMINVTYSGDQLIAYKVTGDMNIPRGEITFTADLLPSDDLLDPIVLSEGSAAKWGTSRLPRFPGRGHVAEPGFVDPAYVEGQLVVIGPGEYFSFAWVELEHQIFFGRPSPQLTLRLLREGGAACLTAGAGLEVPGMDAGLKAQAAYVSRCFEVTSDRLFDELHEGKADPLNCIWHGDDEYCYFE